MFCRLVITPNKNSQGLLIGRQGQFMLADFMESELGYRPFIFNSGIGLFIFAKRKESYKKIENLIRSFLTVEKLKEATIYDTSAHPHFFMLVTKDILTSKEVSPLGWKRLINSFLIQADPFKGKRTDSARVFERFRRCIERYGSKKQKKFYKNRIKVMLSKVSLDSLEDILKV